MYPMSNRREILKLAGMGAAAAFALPAASAKLENGTVARSQAQLAAQSFGDQRTYFDGSTSQLKSIVAGSLLLKPGASPHPPHQHAEEEILIVAEGTAEITLEGKASQAGPGSVTYCAGGCLHGIVNAGKVPLLFYYTKWLA